MKKLNERVGLIPWISIGLLFFILLPACQPPPTETLPTAVVEQATEKQTATPSIAVQATESTPSGNRESPITYLVEEGDTLSNIAAHFAISPQTLIWANYSELFDNPDYLLPGMQLLILPTDGVYHQVGGSDTLLSLAAFFAVDASAILDWPANNLDAQNTSVQAGQWLMIPGGQRASRWRQMPNVLRRDADLSAEEFGSGACDTSYIVEVIGTQNYVSPLNDLSIRGEVLSSWHSGLDLAVEIGQQVLAADHGVVVFSGWSNLGYGNMLMIDHGNGDFSLYSGLSSLSAACGHTVRQGDPIAEAGATGHPAGPFLHFEIRRGTDFLDPLALISTP